MEPVSVELYKSLFFKARTVTLPFASSSRGYAKRIHDEMNPESESSSSSSASSSSGHSTRIGDLMKLKSEAGMSKEEAEIEASKSHWTVTTPMSTEWCEELLETEKLYKENVEVMRSLQREDVGGRFFEIGGTVSGKKIAEGGQASIYDGGLRHDERFVGTEPILIPIVLKVFKGAISLLEFRKKLPLALLQKYNIDSKEYFQFNPLWCGRLLEDGRFAFEMVKYWGDLRKLLDARLIENGNQHPPLMMSNGHYLECCMLEMWLQIAIGMEELHERGILHKDMKASNVLMESGNWPTSVNREEGRLDPLNLKHAFECRVADYECSLGIVGTGFWRAPEVLKLVKNGNLHTIPNFFTPAVDVYSYAMTCYEILTRLVPFEHVEDHGTRIEDVIEGKRPTLPEHLSPWVEEMFCKCWHQDPMKRPSFLEIRTHLGRINDICLNRHRGASYFRRHVNSIPRIQRNPTQC